jgi:prepilin-type N-terminal cleavage/methylation domain-containing protein
MTFKKDSIKNGYTLIELITVISIILIISGFSFSYYSHHMKLCNYVDIEYCSESIVYIVDHTKQYCRENGVSGYVLFDFSNNAVSSSCSGKRLNKFYLPNGCKLYRINAKNNMVDINNNGLTGDACTIIYKDKNGLNHHITICVGSSNVEIQD